MEKSYTLSDGYLLTPPVSFLFRKSLSSVLINIAALVHIAIVPTIAAVLATGLFLSTTPIMIPGSVEQAETQPIELDFGLWFYVSLIGLLVALLACFVLFAVPWMRRVLLGPEHYKSRLLSRWDRSHTHVIRLLLLLILLFGWLPILVHLVMVNWENLTGLQLGIGTTNLLGAVLIAAVFLGALFWNIWLAKAFCRLGVMLPATAIGMTYAVDEAWLATRKIQWRVGRAFMLLALVFFGIPMVLLLPLQFLLVGSMGMPPGTVVFIWIAGVFMSLIFGLIPASLALLCEAFRHCSGWKAKTADVAG